MNFRNLPNSLGQDRKVRLQLTVGSLRKTSEIFFLFPAVKVKANIGGSESIWGMEVDLMGRTSHRFFLGGRDR